MFRISKKADYAILLVTFIARQAVRSDGGETPISAQELATVVPIGKPTIANLLKSLTRASILDSVRGVNGGYRLARPAAEISLAQILEAIDGRLSIVDCGSVAKFEDAPCELTACCTTHHPLMLLQQRIGAMLDGIKLAEFVSSCPLPTFLMTTTPTLQAQR